MDLFKMISITDFASGLWFGRSIPLGEIHCMRKIMKKRNHDWNGVGRGRASTWPAPAVGLVKSVAVATVDRGRDGKRANGLGSRSLRDAMPERANKFAFTDLRLERLKPESRRRCCQVPGP